MAYVQRFRMIQIDCVTNRIIKNNVNRRSEKNMDKYALFNSDEDKNKVENLQSEIMKVCDVDNIFAVCKFETSELELMKKIKDNFDDDNANKKKVYLEFVSKDILNKFKIKISELKNKLQTNAFKKYYFDCLKRKSVLNCNIKKSVEVGKILLEVENEQICLNKEYDESVVQLNKIQLDSLENYEKMLQDFGTKTQIGKSLDDILNKYPLDTLKVYLKRKIVYLITHNFSCDILPQILYSLENSERFKSNFELVYDDVLEGLRCGNK